MCALCECVCVHYVSVCVCVHVFALSPNLVPRLLPSFLSHTVCDKKLGMRLLSPSNMHTTPKTTAAHPLQCSPPPLVSLQRVRSRWSYGTLWDAFGILRCLCDSDPPPAHEAGSL